MTRGAALLLCSLLGAQPLAAREPPRVELPLEHRHPSGAFTWRTPAGWEVRPGARPDDLELRAAGAALGARIVFFYEARELGYDSLHVSCMEARLAGPMQTERVTYEYDFLSAEIGPRRLLDSALRVRYDAPVDGEREWRQRNLTIAGPEQSLCVIAHVPLRLWKKSAQVRALVDAVVQSLAFQGDAPAGALPSRHP